MSKSVVEYVAEYAISQPDKVAVVVRGNSTTYGELYDFVRQYAYYLKNMGINKGDIVVLRASQTLEYVVLYLAIHLSGGIVTSLEKNISDFGVMDVIEQIHADAIITDNNIYRERFPDIKIIEKRNVLEKRKNSLIENYNNIFPKSEDSADILFTTGTTGHSKGVEITHRALVATAENLISGCRYNKDTVLVAPGPLNHANAIRKLYTTLINGSTIYILNGMLNLKSFFDALNYTNGKVSCCLPPSAIRTILQNTGDKLGEYADKIDFIESATSPLPEVDKNKLCSLLPRARLYNLYGASETGSVCMYDYNEYSGKENCVGFALPNTKVIIVDDNRNEIRSSKFNTGFIACIGDTNMIGYVGDLELTKNTIQNGTVYTNDVGYIDQEGFIYVTGRNGDIINVGGVKVNPVEVESAALLYGIEDCICIGVDDPVTDKALKLLIKESSTNHINIKELRGFLSKKLEMSKVPRKYEIVDRIERTYNGKLNRKAYYER